MTQDFEDRSDTEIWSARNSASRELGYRLDDRLENLLENYVRLYGPENGIEVLGDRLCRLANQKRFYPKGWDGFVKYLVAASG